MLSVTSGWLAYVIYDRPVSTEIKPKAGLEDIVATSSSICFIDGDRGILAYRGYDIHDLAPKATFEEVCYLLWHGRLPTRAQLGDLQSQFAAGPSAAGRRRFACCGNCRRARRWTRCARRRRRWRTTIATPPDNSPDANYRKAVRLTAQMGSLVAAIGRLEQNQGPIDPDPVMGFAANFLYQLTGTRPDALAVRAIDCALVLHADHELNASTFAARVAAATLTDIHSAIVGGIGALKGPLHGGANAEVMKMLLDFGATASPEKVETHDPREAGEEGEDSRLRPPRLQDDGPARGAPAPVVEGPGQAVGADATGSRCRSASRRW